MIEIRDSKIRLELENHIIVDGMHYKVISRSDRLDINNCTVYDYEIKEINNT